MKLAMFRFGLVAFLLSLSGFVISCKVEEQPQPIFELNSTGIEVPSNGGTAKITYVLENPVAGEKFSFSSADDWVKGFTDESQNTISFKVDSNPETDIRYTEVTVVYSGISRSFQVIQAAADPDAPVFKINENELSVPAEGGAYKVTYSLVNPVLGQTIEISSSEEWVNNFGLIIPEEINFIVDANPLEEARQAIVTATYMGQEQSFTILQDALAPEFVIRLNASTDSSVVFDITPRDKEMTYVARVSSKASFESLTEDELFQKNLDYFNEVAKNAGVSLREVLEIALLKGVHNNLEVPGLRPASDYYIYAYGFSMDAEKLTGITSTPFKTQEVEKIDITFDFSYDIDGVDVEMYVTPSDMETRYYFDVMDKNALDESGRTMAEQLQRGIDAHREVAEMFGVPLEEILRQILSKGKAQTPLQNLMVETEYVGCAAAINDKGYVCSDVSSKIFITGNVQPSDNQITLTLGTPGVDRIQITTTTTNNRDPYVIFPDKSENWEGKSDDEIIEGISKFNLSKNTFSGPQEIIVTGLAAQTEYTIFVFGYKGGVATTGLISQKFTTAEASEDPSTLEFEFEVSDIKINSANAKITAEPKTAAYIWDIVPANVSGEQVIESLNTRADMYIEYGLAKDRAEYFSSLLTRGDNERLFKGLASGFDYHVYAVGLYSETGEFATDVVFSETFRTLAAKETDLRITVDYRYYEADAIVPYLEAAKKYPGHVALRMKANITDGPAGNFRYATYEGDLMDEATNSDAVVISNLNINGQNVIESVVFYPNWDMEHTILAYAEDVDGNLAPVFRKLITSFPRDGVSDPSTFTLPFDSQETALRFSPLWNPMVLAGPVVSGSVSVKQVKSDDLVELEVASEQRKAADSYRVFDFDK